MFSLIRVAMVFTDKEMDLKGKQPGQHLDLELPASRSVGNLISVV